MSHGQKDIQPIDNAERHPFNSFTREDVSVLHQEKGYDGFLAIEKLTLTHKTHSGDQTAPLVREAMTRRPVVAVLPYDPKRDQIVLIQQFRIGPFLHTGPLFPVEIIAGIIDPEDKSADITVRREAREEANLELTDIKCIHKLYPSPGGCSEHLSLYVGLCDASSVDGVYGVAHENEDILAAAVSYDTAQDLIASGMICDAASLLALSWLALHREALRTSLQLP